MATQEQRKAETKRKLINAAKKLFDKHGFEEVSVNEIVKKANVAKGTFYQHYETKVDILADVVRDVGEVKFKEALAAVANGAPALDILDRFINAQCEWFEANEKVAEAIIMAGLRTVGQELQEKHRHSRVFLAKLMMLAQQQQVVREELDPDEIAKVIGSAFVVTVLAWSKNPKPNVLKPSMKQSLDIILNGVKIHD